MKLTIKCLLAPPLVASRYTCGTSCIAPVTILWLASCVCIFFGFNGGPMGRPEISWPTVAFGSVLWILSGCWTMLATQNLKSCQPKKKG